MKKAITTNRYKKRLSRISLAGVITITLMLVGMRETKQTGFGTIIGTCSLPDTTQRSGIIVTVIGQDRSAVTDVSGNFLMSNINAGPVRIQAGKLFYGNAVIDTTLNTGDTLHLSFSLSSAISDTFAAQSTSQFSTAITNVGNLGVPNKFVEAGDSGFAWFGQQQIKEASLMIGVDTTRVSDAARFIFGLAQENLDIDFQPRSDIVTLTSGQDSTTQTTAFDDSRANFPPGIPSQPLGVLVTQTTSSFGAAGESGYLIVDLKIKNTGDKSLDNLLVGWFVDWNVGGSTTTNRGRTILAGQQIPGLNNDFQFSTEITYQRTSSSAGPFMGIVPLSQPKFHASRIASVQQEINIGGTKGSLTEANKYSYMQNRRLINPFGDLGNEEDLASIVSLGGTATDDYQTATFSIQPNGEIEVGFAFVGGNDSLGFMTNALHAQKKWIQQGHAMEVIKNYWQVKEKWNLVSLPVGVTDNNKSVLFPTSTSNLFGFQPDFGYQARDTVATGMGYWVKFPAAGYINIDGALRHADTINVQQGWNLIGAISFPVAITSVKTIPIGIISSSYYGHDSIYRVADTLKPMQGYWVKVNQDGQLILSSP